MSFIILNVWSVLKEKSGENKLCVSSVGQILYWIWIDEWHFSKNVQYIEKVPLCVSRKSFCVLCISPKRNNFLQSYMHCYHEKDVNLLRTQVYTLIINTILLYIVQNIIWYFITSEQWQYTRTFYIRHEIILDFNLKLYFIQFLI